MSYEQWVGPAVTQEDDVRATWSGATKFGYEVHLHNYTNGTDAVLWQQTPTSNWRLKTQDGTIATLSPDLTQVLNVAEAPRQSLQPQRYAPPAYNPPQGGYQQAAEYNYSAPVRRPQYQLTQDQQQAAVAFSMFRMMLCAASGRC
jgi:hypothetical protein